MKFRLNSLLRKYHLESCAELGLFQVVIYKIIDFELKMD